MTTFKFMIRTFLFIIFISFHCFCNAQNPPSSPLSTSVDEALRLNNPFIIKPFVVHERQEYKLYGYTDSTTVFVSDMAICKMECLKINEDDIRAVLKYGIINLGKSFLVYKDKLYTIDDNVKKLRVEATPRGTTLLIVTVSALKRKPGCACK